MKFFTNSLLNFLFKIGRYKLRHKLRLKIFLMEFAYNFSSI